MEETLIIYIGHKSRVGKDTAARLLKKSFEDKGYTVKIMSFATPVKELTAKLFNVTISTIDEHKNNVRFIHSLKKRLLYWLGNILGIPMLLLERNSLIRVGASNASVLGDDVFVKHIAEVVDSGCYDIVIVSDLRLEKELFRTGPTIKIVRDSVIGNGSEIDNCLNAYKFDYTIPNNYGLDLIKFSVDVICDDIVAKAHPDRHVKFMTNVVVKLEDFVKDTSSLAETLRSLGGIKGPQVIITLVYDEILEKGFPDIKHIIDHELDYASRSTYVDNVKLTSLSNIYNIIYISDVKINGFKHHRASNIISSWDLRRIKSMLDVNKNMYVVK